MPLAWNVSRYFSMLMYFSQSPTDWNSGKLTSVDLKAMKTGKIMKKRLDWTVTCGVLKAGFQRREVGFHVSDFPERLPHPL